MNYKNVLIAISIITLIICLLTKNFKYIIILAVAIIVIALSISVEKPVNKDIVFSIEKGLNEGNETTNNKFLANIIIDPALGKVCEMPKQENPFLNPLPYDNPVRVPPCTNEAALKRQEEIFFSGPYKNLLNSPFATLNYMKPWATLPM